MKNKHTKGEWKIRSHEKYTNCHYLEGVEPNRGEQDYNSMLMAASPNMLEALEDVWKLHMDDVIDLDYEAAQKVILAIKKAKGK